MRMAENHMVIGEYYPPEMADSEFRDKCIRDAVNARSFDWITSENAVEILCDVAKAVFSAKDSREAGTEAYSTMYSAIEVWAETEVEETK